MMMKINKPFKGNWIKHGFETMYVIVGILVAFSLEDWNENRKAQNTELYILNELISGLSTDSSTFSFNIAMHNQAIKSCEIILKALNEDGVYNDSLASHFAAINNYTVFASARGAYESLKSMGFETLSNKSLRLEIIDLYDQMYITLQTNEKILIDDIHELKRNFYPDLFDRFQVVVPVEPYYTGEMTPVDFQQLKLNQQFKYHIRSLQAAHSFYNWQNRFIVDKATSLINSCRKEIKRLE